MAIQSVVNLAAQPISADPMQAVYETLLSIEGLSRTLQLAYGGEVENEQTGIYASLVLLEKLAGQAIEHTGT